MKPILYEIDETEFASNGLGRLADAVSCTVTEERNGQFEAVLKYPVTGVHYNDIKDGRIIYCTHDDSKLPQPFDIYKVSKPNKGIITVCARHISYRLSKYVTMPVMVMGLYAQDMFDAIMSNVVGDFPFTLQSDVQQMGTMNVPRPSSIRSLFGDSEDCMLYCFGGEYYYDKFHVYLLENRGSNNGVKIRRGKNVKELIQEVDRQEIVTAVIPYWSGQDPTTGDDKYVQLPEKVVYAEDANLYPYQMAQPLDLSYAFEYPPTEEELRAGANTWLNRNMYNTRHRANYSVDLTPVAADTEDLQKIQSVRLCDIVTVQDPVINVNVTMKVTKTVYNVLRDRYDRIEVGDTRRTLSYAMHYNNRHYVQQTENNTTQIKALAKSAKRAGGANNSNGQFIVSNSKGKENIIFDKDGAQMGTEEDPTDVDIKGSLTVNGKEITGTGGGGGGLPLGPDEVQIDQYDSENTLYNLTGIDIKNVNKKFAYLRISRRKSLSDGTEAYFVRFGEPTDNVASDKFPINLRFGYKTYKYQALVDAYGTFAFEGPDEYDTYGNKKTYHSVKRQEMTAFSASTGKWKSGTEYDYEQAVNLANLAIQVLMSCKTTNGQKPPVDETEYAVTIGNPDAKGNVLLVYGKMHAKDGIVLTSPGGKYFVVTVDDSGNLSTTEITD